MPLSLETKIWLNRSHSSTNKIAGKRQVSVPNVIPGFNMYSTVPTHQDCLTIHRRAADSDHSSTGAYIFLDNVVRVALRVVNQNLYFYKPQPLGVGF